MERARQAFANGREKLAIETAQTSARMEHELERRPETVRRLETRILQRRHSIETANRRLTDLKQGAPIRAFTLVRKAQSPG